MKRETAIKKALRVAERLMECNGIIGTPEANYTAYRVKRLWLFGSTAKGKENPNDVDLLIEAHGCGTRQVAHKTEGINRNAKVNKRYLRATGMTVAVLCWDVAYKSLRQNMKMIRFHDLAIDGNLAYPRIMLYPRNDLAGK